MAQAIAISNADCTPYRDVSVSPQAAPVPCPPARVIDRAVARLAATRPRAARASHAVLR